MYVENSTIHAIKAAVTSLRQHPNKSPITLKHVIFRKASQCEKFTTNHIHRFLQGLHPDVQYHVPHLHLAHPNFNLDGLARHLNEIHHKKNNTYTIKDHPNTGQDKFDTSLCKNYRNNDTNTHARSTLLLATDNIVDWNYSNNNINSNRNATARDQ